MIKKFKADLFEENYIEVLTGKKLMEAFENLLGFSWDWPEFKNTSRSGKKFSDLSKKNSIVQDKSDKFRNYSDFIEYLKEALHGVSAGSGTQHKDEKMLQGNIEKILRELGET